MPCLFRHGQSTLCVLQFKGHVRLTRADPNLSTQNIFPIHFCHSIHLDIQGIWASCLNRKKLGKPFSFFGCDDPSVLLVKENINGIAPIGFAVPNDRLPLLDNHVFTEDWRHTETSKITGNCSINRTCNDASSFIFLIGTLGLALFISTITRTQQQFMFAGFFFLIIFMLMRGIFTPLESMPVWAQEVNRINPVSYIMPINRMVMLKGSTFGDIRNDILSLSVLSVMFTFFAIGKYRKTA
ncbi:MAG TPA: hypothetical protein DCY35_03610 [Prolixibacteraceae bacterium]|nr:hypothetical protein [Prolixibacteraceae bacterium]